jgi:hypothetical protein
MMKLEKIQSINIQIKYNVLGENVIAERQDFKDLIISLKSGHLKIKKSNQNGYYMAWAPIGIMVINGKSEYWFTGKNDKMLNKYYKSPDQ